MRNFQIIDDATNCSFSIYAISNNDFSDLFPNQRDIEFLDDAMERLGEAAVGRIMRSTWKSLQQKPLVQGIHGTLFIGKGHAHRKQLYPNKKETDLDRTNS
jgi:hypothetical protein